RGGPTRQSPPRHAVASRLAVEAVGVVPKEFLLRLRLQVLPGENVVDRVWELAFRMRVIRSVHQHVLAEEAAHHPVHFLPFLPLDAAEIASALQIIAWPHLQLSG